MANRPLHPATAAAIGQNVVYEGWFIRLDIEDDPVQIWTGGYDVTFAGTDDAALNGIAFEGRGVIGGIGEIVDGAGGSQSVKLTLAGVDLEDEALKQVVFDKRRWKRRQAWLWVATLDENYQVVGTPFRVKTGRMDKMRVGQGRGQNYVEVTIESHQGYSTQPTMTGYYEMAAVLDSADQAEAFVHDLANRQAIIGGTTANNAAVPPSGGSSVTSRDQNGILANLV